MKKNFPFILGALHFQHYSGTYIDHIHTTGDHILSASTASAWRLAVLPASRLPQVMNPNIVGNNSDVEMMVKNDILHTSMEWTNNQRLPKHRGRADQGLSTERGTAR